MAKLWKTTLYICDLEEDLSLDEIKALIDQSALNGCAINLVSHFADEQEGPCVEWYDDIDINQLDCPTEAWDKYFHGQDGFSI